MATCHGGSMRRESRRHPTPAQSISSVTFSPFATALNAGRSPHGASCYLERLESGIVTPIRLVSPGLIPRSADSRFLAETYALAVVTDRSGLLTASTGSVTIAVGWLIASILTCLQARCHAESIAWVCRGVKPW